jgi:hypothetical protein
MTEQPGETIAASEGESIKRFRGEGWHNIWGVVLILFLGCVGVCLYLIASAGPGGMVEGRLFGTAAIIALFLGMALLARWSVPFLLTKSASVDPRSADLMRSPRSPWYWLRRGPRW